MPGAPVVSSMSRNCTVAAAAALAARLQLLLYSLTNFEWIEFQRELKSIKSWLACTYGIGCACSQIAKLLGMFCLFRKSKIGFVSQFTKEDLVGSLLACTPLFNNICREFFHWHQL